MADTTVSWQSAYYGLVAIALNTMTQPGGRVCDFATISRLHLRSSPIVCLVDTIQILVHFVSNLWQGDSFRDAVTRIANDRFEEAEAGEEDSLKSLRRTAVTRWTVFAISGVTQIIKIFAFSGIPWTKTCAAAYVASWVLVEILVFCSMTKDNVPSRHRSQSRGWGGGKSLWGATLSEWLGILAVFGQSILNTVGMFTAGSSWFFDHESGFTYSGKVFVKIIWLPAFGVVAPMFLATFVMGILFILGRVLGTALQAIGGDISMSCGNLLMTTVYVSAAAAFVLGHVLYWKYDFWEFFGGASDAATMLFGLFFLFGFFSLVLLASAAGGPLHLAPLGRFAFLLTTLFGALSFYATHYDSTGTEKREWTNLLG